MSEPFFNPSWYRVARLKPRLRGHARIHRHEYRGETWYVLQDQAKGRYYRFTPVAYHLIGRMDGARTVQELWEDATARFGDDAPTQGDVVQLLGQLHSADVLLCDVPPDTAELLRRSARIERAKWTANLRSPLAIRFPLLDPDAFLNRTVSLVRPLFGAAGALLWLATVGTAAALAGMHWSELTEGLADRVLSAGNLFILWLVYPLVKTLHEFGHAYAIKVRGGEVHEMGIMLLVLMPVPYVDASAASEFRSRRHRVVVGAAGILVELFLAALATFAWTGLEPGAARSVVYNVMLIGGVSTLLFNGNPLLRYDGYYMLSDLLDIPNLGQRGLAYVGYLGRRHLLRIRGATPPYAGPGERLWFVVYTVLSFVYRAFVYVAIALFIAGKFFVIGILLALWAVFNMAVAPLAKGAWFLLTSPQLRESRAAALTLTGAAALGLGLLLTAVPVPSRTRAEGVVWVPEEALVRARADGFITRIVRTPGSRVTRGDLLVECRDPLLVAGARVWRARLEELESRYDAAVPHSAVDAEIIRKDIEAARSNLARAEEKLADLAIRSPADGLFVIPDAADLPDRHVRQGTLLGYVLDIERPTVRVVVPQPAVDLVRQRARGVEVRFAERLAETRPAAVRREVPGAAERLPSTILGSAGGGEIAIDPFDPRADRALQTLFQFDLEVAGPVEPIFVGGRVHVLFDHGPEPIAAQVYRGVRQMFLKRFNV
jgi:putative peptide zinc metalloprotease protein